MKNKNIKKIISLFFLLFSYNENHATITFHTPQSSINLAGTKTQLAIVPVTIKGWPNRSIIQETTKALNIKIESNFTGDTLQQEFAPTELSIENQNNIEILTQDTTNNSNAIIENDQAIINNSNAIVQNKENIKNNSNSIIKLNEGPTYGDLQTQIDSLEINVKENSNAIISNDASTLNEYITANSNAIVTLEPLVKQNSNAIVTQNNKIIYNSNTIITMNRLTIQNSNSIVSENRLITYNSNSIVTIDTLINQNSNTVVTDNPKIRYNSNATVSNDRNIKYNSSAIITIKENSDTTHLQNQIDDNIDDIKNNSNTIVTNKRNIDTNTSNISINLGKINTNTSNISSNAITISQHGSRITSNENNITYNINNIKYNSNAIIKLNTSGSYDDLQADIDTNIENINNNSNSIVTLSVEKGETIVTQGPITGNLTLEESSFINPDKKIEINGNVILDGNGAVLIFGGTEEPQFVVNPGKTVTLKNIQLLRVNQKTFHLNFRSYLNGSTWNIDDSKIIIGENVIFGLSEDITFSQGLIEITNNDASEAQTFQLKGIEGQKQFIIDPSDRYSNALSKGDNGLTWDARKDGQRSREVSRLPDRFTLNSTIPVLLKSNDNSLAIQNIKLSGFEHITQSETTSYKGKLALVGEAEVNIGDYTFNDFETNQDKKEKYNTNFFIQGINNTLRLLKDDLKFTGELRFADFGESSLEIQTMLTEKIVPDFDDPKRNIPQINFGTDFIELSSTLGLAKLIFSDNRIRIKNDTNAFKVYGNSLLEGKTIEITGNAIQDLYDSTTGDNEFIINTYQLIGLADIDYKPIIQTNYRTAKYNYNKKSAIDLIYEREINKILNS